MPIAQLSGSALQAAHNRLFENDGSSTQFRPRFLLIKVPANLATNYPLTLSGGDYTLPSGHPYVVGEVIKLATPPVTPTPPSHPYYWIKTITGNVANLSAVGPDAADPSLVSTAASTGSTQIDLPAERSAHKLLKLAGFVSDRAAIFSATLKKNEVLHGAPGAARPELLHPSAADLVVPAGWPTTGKLSYKVTCTPYTLNNSGATPIAFRHVVVQMSGGPNQGDSTLNPLFFPETTDTTIAVGAQQLFNFTLGTQEA